MASHKQEHAKVQERKQTETAKKKSKLTKKGDHAEPNAETQDPQEAIVKLLGFRLSPQEKITVGIDVHRKKYHVALWAHQRAEQLRDWAQSSSLEVLLKRLEPIRQQVDKIYYEAGPCGYGLARDLQKAGYRVSVIAPSHTDPPAKGQKRPKCDRRDAQKLARLGGKGELKEIYIPSEQEEQDRQVFRTREQRKRQLACCKQRIKSFLLYHGIELQIGQDKAWSNAGVAELKALVLPQQLRWAMDELLLELRETRAAVARLNQLLRQMARTPQYRDRVLRMRTIKGVGLIVAMGMLLELMDMQRFENERMFSRYLGLAPCTRTSDQTTHEDGRISAGMSTLRSLLIEAAWRWQAKDPYALGQYKKYLRNTGKCQKAITALARKLGIILWRIAQGSLPYVPGLVRVPPVVVGMKPSGKKQSAPAVGMTQPAQ